MIAYHDVVLRYPRAANPAIAGVSLTAPRGTVTAVAGPNGSGKSTLVRALLGTVPLAAGRIEIDGTPLGRSSARERARRIAVVPQREDLVFPLPVREYVALGRFPHEGWWPGGRGRAGSGREAEAEPDDVAIDRAVATAEVGALVARHTDALSGGEWQRVRIARALAQGGEALVLDEPTTFLDIAHEMATFELLARLARDGMAILLVTHQLNLVARFAQSMVLLDRGRIAAAGTPDDVMRAPVLEAVYGWPLVVTRDPAVGAPALLPLRVRS